jgi:hypothetical protein
MKLSGRKTQRGDGRWGPVFLFLQVRLPLAASNEGMCKSTAQQTVGTKEAGSPLHRQQVTKLVETVPVEATERDLLQGV